MQRVNVLYNERDLDTLRQMMQQEQINSTTKNAEFIDVAYLNELEKEIAYYQSTCAFTWKKGGYFASWIESEFLTPQEKLEENLVEFSKLFMENEYLKKQNEGLREMVCQDTLKIKVEELDSILTCMVTKIEREEGKTACKKEL